MVWHSAQTDLVLFIHREATFSFPPHSSINNLFSNWYPFKETSLGIQIFAGNGIFVKCHKKYRNESKYFFANSKHRKSQILQTFTEFIIMWEWLTLFKIQNIFIFLHFWHMLYVLLASCRIRLWRNAYKFEFSKHLRQQFNANSKIVNFKMRQIKILCFHGIFSFCSITLWRIFLVPCVYFS